VKAYNPAKNYYKVLNITESATQKDIKRSFRELAKKYHPDSTKGK
jgi:DnaJ-class molecular chaperone